MRVGVAGLGLMGSGIATRLVNTEHVVSVYNRSSAKAKRFSKSATVASSPKDLADTCDLVIIVVTDFEAVKEVLLGKGGIIESANRDVILADASTISPSQSEHCVQELRRQA